MENNSFIKKIATVIVDKKNIVLLLYAMALVFSFVSSNWVEVCNDLTAYLPQNTETRQGLSIMEDEFVTFASSRVMVTNITYDEADKIYEDLKAMPCVSMVTFDDTEEYYSGGNALFEITYKSEDGSDEAKADCEAVDELLSEYDTYAIHGGDDADSLASEMTLILAIAAVIIVFVLLLTSKSYMEVPVLLITFVAGILLNKGTNFIFGEISFVSNSVTAVLQLALSIDYAIILIHHYSEERETKDIREAVIAALTRSIPEIFSSSLTTVSGLMALMFMQFKIGFDMGICLVKSILFSLLCVFTLMPCLLMFFGRYIDKTHHKNLLPDISFLGSFVYKIKAAVPPVFAAVLVIGYFLSSHCLYTYNADSSETSRKNETQIAKEMIEENFGAENIAALIIPTGDYEKEKKLIHALEKYPQVESITGLSSVEAKDGYVLTDKLTPRQFSELTDIDINLTKLLYSAYAAENEDYSKLITNMTDFSVPIIDMFMFAYDLKEDGYVKLDEDVEADLDDMYIQLDTAKKQLYGENYSRMLLHLDLPLEGEETFKFIDTVHDVTGEFYDTSYFVGDSTSCYDLAEAFDTDNIIVSVLSILFVIMILFLTFKNAGLPVLLIVVIQGSIWINFSMSYITGTNMFFLSYLIVSSIQMGANIDYAIVISSRYMELKQEMSIKKAMRGALNFAFPTILTSGSILASAGFLISKLSTEPSIVSIGLALCRGTLISMFLVMLVMPEILLFGDSIIEKSGVKIKHPNIVRKETGNFNVDGRIKGRVNGYIDAEIHGRIRGDVEAVLNIDNISKEAADDEKDDE